MFLTKVLLLGYAGASYIEENFIDITFSKRYLYTIGADFSVKKINFNEKEFKFQIWRISDNERFRNLRTIFYLGSHAVILCFDVTRPSTIDNLFLNWLPELERNLKDIRIPFILVGINTHKREDSDPNHISKEQGHSYAKRISKLYSEGALPVYYFELSPLVKSSSLIFYTLAKFILSLKNYGHIILDNELPHFSSKSAKAFISSITKSINFILLELTKLHEFSLSLFDQITISELKEKIKLINKIDLDLASLSYVIDDYVLKDGKQDKRIVKLIDIVNNTNKRKNDILNRLYSSLSIKNFIIEVTFVKTNIKNWMNELDILMVQKRNVQTVDEYSMLKENFNRILSHTNSIKLIKKPNFSNNLYSNIDLNVLYQGTLFAINNFKKTVYNEYNRINELQYSIFQTGDYLNIIDPSLEDYKIICFADRAKINGNSIKLAYHCPVCKIFICDYCYNSLMEDGDDYVLCPGTMISSEHIIEFNK